jgi:S-formylglutathione hydrolase
MADALKTLSESACFGGVQGFYSHESRECDCEMRFAVYRPPQAATRPVPVLFYLAGLTCTEETFLIRAGAQRIASQLGLMLVAPDTSPRIRLPGDDASWDFGLGAGFYVDATEPPWADHYRMYSYVTRELPSLIARHFRSSGAHGVFGHSMGGHGALVCALREPQQYRSVSAFAPIAAPSSAPWGVKAFSGYLGSDRQRWAEYDASELVARRPYPAKILIDQGTADKFLDEQLRPQRLRSACDRSGTPLELRLQQGYDHSYWFVSTFVEDHLHHHAAALLSG